MLKRLYLFIILIVVFDSKTSITREESLVSKLRKVVIIYANIHEF